MQLAAEQWITAEKTKVLITIDAALDDKQPMTIQQELKADLAKLADVEWRITYMERRVDDTGMEKIRLFAEARMPEETTANLRKKAEKLSRAGKQFQVTDVLFTPTLNEIENAQAQLREKVYAQAQQELERVSQRYKDTEYFIHEIYFMNESPIEPVGYLASSMGHEVADRLAVAVPVSKEGESSQGAALQVSSKVRVSADVILGSRIDD